MNADQKFLEEAPEGFDPTMELKWIECGYFTPNKSLLQRADGDGTHHVPLSVVLCQKYRGAFRDCWVRVPIQET